jgi:hypothetical protein
MLHEVAREQKMLNDIILIFLCISAVLNTLLIGAIQFTLKLWLPRIKEFEATAETLKLELWGRL